MLETEQDKKSEDVPDKRQSDKQGFSDEEQSDDKLIHKKKQQPKQTVNFPHLYNFKGDLRRINT